MNIFYLDVCPIESAQMSCNKHVVKMILETSQLLSTAHHILDGDSAIQGIYKSTHKNHPSAIWARENSANYIWLLEHFSALCDEYTYRYGRIHKSSEKLELLSHLPINITKSATMSPMPQCMPDEFKVDGDSVKAYQNYYIGAKHSILQYKRREIPKFLSSIGLGEQV